MSEVLKYRVMPSNASKHLKMPRYFPDEKAILAAKPPRRVSDGKAKSIYSKHIDHRLIPNRS